MPKRKEPGKGSGNLLIAQQEAFSDNPNGEVLTKEKDSTALIEKMGVEWLGVTVVPRKSRQTALAGGPRP
jgi:hypothetical protein